MTRVLHARYGRRIIVDPLLLDGLYESLSVTTFPCSVRASFLLVIEFDRQEVQRQTVLTIDFRDATGDLIAILRQDEPLTIPAATEPSRTAIQVFDLPLDRVVFQQMGWYITRVTVDGQRLIDVPIAVHEARPMARQTQAVGWLAPAPQM